MRAAHYYRPASASCSAIRAPWTVYKKAVKSFADAAAMSNGRASIVEVPYGDTIAAGAVRPSPRPKSPATKPGPALVFFDGFDVTKEIQYFKGVPDLAARGIACLIVDGPGNGESVRFRDLPLIAETEKYAHRGLRISRRAQGGRPKRIGVMAISLGGYYAPRAASFERRYAAASPGARSGTITTSGSGASIVLDSGKVPSLSVPPEHLHVDLRRREPRGRP